MHRQKVEFEALPEGAGQPYVLHSRVLDMRDQLGNGALLDLSSEKRFAPLAEDLVVAFGQHALFAIDSAYSFNNYKSSLTRVLEFAGETCLPGSVRLADFDEELILKYRAHIKFRPESTKNASQRRIYGDFTRLIDAAKRVGLSTVGALPRNFRHIDDSTTTQPYTFYEQIDLEEVCRKQIESTLSRLELGIELAKIGSNPLGVRNGKDCKVEDRAWNRLENLIWYVTNIHGDAPLTQPEIYARKEYSFLNAIHGNYGRVHRLEDIQSYRYVTCEDLIPFFILLAKRTGRNESSLLTLKRNCLQLVDGKYYLEYEKGRSERKIYRRMVSAEGPYSAVWLIETLLRITENSAKVAQPISDRNLLFLGMTVGSRIRIPIKRLDPSYFKYQMNRKGGWCERNRLEDAAGAVLQISTPRLRVTYLTKKYLKHGQLSKASTDAAHSLAETTLGYVTNDASKPVHNKATRDAQRSAISLATRPTVLPSGDSRSAAKALNIPESSAKKIVSGGLDVLFNSCKDIKNRPGGPKDSFCDKPWQCFTCANCVVTRHSLPRLYGFIDHAESMKSELSSSGWETMFGPSIRTIEADVLTRFSDRARQDAESAAKRMMFYIPLELRGNA